MFSRASTGLVLALSLAATTLAVGCAGEAGEDVASDEGAATSASALAHDYEGTIGNLKVLIRLDAQGGNVTGSYFYADKVGNGDTLVLKGTVNGNKLSLTESVNGVGATTGTFSGTITSAGINGSWWANEHTLPLALAPIKSLKTVKHKFVQKAPKSNEEFARECSLDAEVVEVYGIDPKVSKAITAALKVEPLDKAADGTCDRDIRWVNQSVALNAAGFLSISVGTEYDGGAHPSNEETNYLFNLATGANLGPNEIFLPDSAARVKALIEVQIIAEPEMTAEEKQEQLAQFQEYFTADTKLEFIAMSVGTKGITVNMGNTYPHVILALAPVVTIPWSDLADILNPAAGLGPIAH